MAALQINNSAKAFMCFPQQYGNLTTHGSNLHLPLRYKPIKASSFETNSLASALILASSMYVSLSNNRNRVTARKPCTSVPSPLAFLPAVSSLRLVFECKYKAITLIMQDKIK